MLILALLGESGAEAAEETAKGTVIILVDRSSSIAELPVPDTTSAMIAHTVSVARVAKVETKFLVIVFSGQGVQVIGDEDNQPTANYEVFLQQVQDLLPEPNGGTPLTEALQKCRDVIADLPEGEQVTIVATGDGQPSSGYQAGVYPAVDAFVEKRVASVSGGDLASYFQEIQDPNSAESKRLGEVLHKAEMTRCLKVVGELRSKADRFVTIDLNGVADLKTIHDAAGGAENDYVIVEPANQLVQHLEKLGLTRYQGVAVPKAIALAANDESTQRIKIDIDPIADMALVSLVFEQPIPAFGNDFVLQARINGHTRKFNGEDPDLLTLKDSSGQVAMLSMFLPTRPTNGIIELAYKDTQGRPVPVFSIFRHLRLSDHLQMVVRPLNAPVDAEAPYSISPNQPVLWQAYLLNKETDTPIDVKLLQATLVERRSQQKVRLELTDAGQGFFSTSESIRLERGDYDVAAVVLLKSNDALEMKLSEHVLSGDVDEVVTLELDDSSASTKLIDFGGDVGDDVREKTVTVQLRSLNINYPLAVDLSIVDVADSAGNPIDVALLKTSKKTLTLVPGRPTKVGIQLQLPEYLHALENGGISARLHITRTDIDQAVPVRSFDDPSVDDCSISDIRFYLRQPEFQVVAKRGWRNELTSSAEGNLLRIPVDVWWPFTRRVRLEVEHDSQRVADATVLLRTPFRNAEGRSNNDLTIDCDAQQREVQQIDAGRTQTFEYDLGIPFGLSDLRLLSELVVRAPGFRPLKIDVELAVRNPLLAPALRRVLMGLASLGAVGAVWAYVFVFRNRKYARNSTIEITPKKHFEFLKLENGKHDTARLRIGDRSVKCMKNGQLVTAPRTIAITADSVSPDNPLRFVKKDGKHETVIDVVQVRTAGKPLVRCQLQRAGLLGRSLQSSKRRFRVLVPLSGAAVGVAAFLETPPVVAVTQFILDVLKI
jgi:hypothetical protein